MKKITIRDSATTVFHVHCLSVAFVDVEESSRHRNYPFLYKTTTSMASKKAPPPPAATSAPPEWPPSSLAAVNSKWIAAECEDLQVAGNTDAAVVIVHMAALLHAQEWDAARHLYRRLGGVQQFNNNSNNYYYYATTLQSLLDPWYRVAATALQGQWTAVEPALQNVLQYSKDSMPSILVPLIPIYVQEIAQAFRVKCCQPWLQQGRQPPAFLVHALLGGQQQQQAEALMVSALESDTDDSIKQQETRRMVSFLESRMTAPSTLPSSS